MEQTDTETLYLLEERQAFSKSLLWEIQRHYFGARGADAWRSGEVPHYVTSNPVIADAYAEIMFAFRRDRQALFPGNEPLYICELGSGSGRFAFHFLKRLLHLCTRHGVSPLSFRYVLTDFTQSNLDAWRMNPCFSEFFDSGLLDMTLFDVNHSAELALQISGERLTAGTLRSPLVAIANYLFDSVPQALYYFNDGAAHECLLSLATEEDPAELDAAELLERLHLHYDYRPCAEPPEEAALLALYAETLDNAHVLVPAAGLNCLRRLRELAPEFDSEERSRVTALIDEVWEMYFPLGEDRDLAYGMGCLLYEMDDYPRALHYFERSLDIYGPHTGTYYNMAVCHHLLNQAGQALPLLQRLLETDPGNAPALDLLNLCREMEHGCHG